MNKKEKELKPLSDILSAFFTQHLNKSDQWFCIKLWQSWSQLATDNIFKQTKPVHYQNGRLVLWVANSVELQELSFHIEVLKDKINLHFEKQWVKDIHFTVNEDILKKREQAAKFLQKINY